MSLLSAAQAADLTSIQRVTLNLGSNLVLIGATAYRAFLPESARYTEDIDVAIALDLDDLDRLESALNVDGWTREAGSEHRWIGPNRTRMDILPAGPKLRATGKLTWPRSGTAMSLAGFTRAFECAVDLEVVSGLRVSGVPLPVLFLLKVVSYLDDPSRRTKDLDDIHVLLRSYEQSSDRVFSDTVFDAQLPDVEFVPAFLLGLDVARLCQPDERVLIDRFLTKCSDQSSVEFSRLLRYEVILEPSEGRLALRPAAFRQGMQC